MNASYRCKLRWWGGVVVAVVSLLIGCTSPEPPMELKGTVYEGLVGRLSPSGNPMGGFVLTLVFFDEEFLVEVYERELVRNSVIGSPFYGQPTGEVGFPKSAPCSYESNGDGVVIKHPIYKHGIRLQKADNEENAYVVRCFLGEFMHVGRVRRVGGYSMEP